MKIDDDMRSAGVKDVQALLALLRKGSSSTSTELKAVWDYRMGGLRIKEARARISQWQEVILAARAKKEEEELDCAGKALRAHYALQRARRAHARLVAEVEEIPWYNGKGCGGMTWRDPRRKTEVEGKLVILIRLEDVRWGTTYCRRPWPVSRQVVYKGAVLYPGWDAPPTAAQAWADTLPGYRIPQPTLHLGSARRDLRCAAMAALL